jgi:hypothetical protein
MTYGPSGRQRSHYHPSRPSYSPDTAAERFNSAELFMAYDEPEEPKIGQKLDLPEELHVPSQAPPTSQMAFPGMTSSTGLATHAQLWARPGYSGPRQEYSWESTAVVRAPDEREYGIDDNAGQATTASTVHPSAASLPHEPETGHQRGLTGQGYYLAPPTTQWSSEPPAVSFVNPSGRETPGYQSRHNSIDATYATYDTLQPRHQQSSQLPSSLTAHSDLLQSFPLDNDEHRIKREALNAVMQSSWKQNNEFEPEASFLLQFMSLDPTEGRWHCTFWKDGRPCDCSCKKRDHAKGHIRSHIDHLPFVCNSHWCVSQIALRGLLEPNDVFAVHTVRPAAPRDIQR